ncbi:hypothetical protein Baya_14272 [Bagarius yarrelli]|uniref:Uncharacterized protein n=1 Tax=Bagarius yarrelli TaxID=175774 RepID=A0A556V928_BAGYA|nr:hypothetical protein Baya_14272 [Bagarius yarrelli]
MKTSSLDRITGLSLRAVCVLALATLASVVSVQEAMQTAETFTGVESAPPEGLSEINSECWDVASEALIETRKMSTDNDVDSLALGPS